MSDLTTLAASLRDMLGPGIGVGVSDPKAPDGTLWPAEEAAIARAVPKRVLEFTAGRTAARAAMADIGHDPCPIPMAPDRAPIWPDTLIGSIAHCDSACIAAVAPADQFRALGIDIEAATPLADDLWDTICAPSERSWLNSQPSDQRGLLAKVIFSAKESVYKAQYPLTGTLIGFEAVEILISGPQAVFSASFPRPVGLTPRGLELSGRFAQVQDVLITCLAIGAGRQGFAR